MTATDASSDSPGDPAHLIWAAELQDHLLTASHDLSRLQTLLDDSHEAMQSGFFGLLGVIEEAPGANGGDAASVAAANRHMASAIKALQFQDLASQLINHTSRRLRNCADRLASDTFAGGDDEGETVIEAAPLQPNPVTQSEMDTGFVELF